MLDTVQVQTPDRALDLMLNQWLLYQTLACRLWARTAFYQSSGAYGYRDQLQDVMALAVSRPDLTRAHIIKAAAHQFVEGDVQHWWHEPCDRGIRTRFSDDLLWLPYVTSHYLDVTADHAVLDERIPFIEGALLAAGQLTSYFEPRVASEHGYALRTLRARARSEPRRRRARPAADGNRRLERRDESRGRPGARARACGSPGSFRASWRRGLPLATARGETIRAHAWA